MTTQLEQPADRRARSGPVHRTLAILEVVAERGGASAQEIAGALNLPVPTVYRLARDLVDGDYLVHIREEHRYELGYKLHQLGVSLHHQIGLSRAARSEITALHQRTGFAAYLAIHRGGELVVVLVVDSPACPRLRPMGFGFQETPHATAFGKILLSDLEPVERHTRMARHGMRRLTERTVVDQPALARELDQVAVHGIAWEWEEFQHGAACAAVPVRGEGAVLLGSVAISAPPASLRGREAAVVGQLRETASRITLSVVGPAR